MPREEHSLVGGDASIVASHGSAGITSGPWVARSRRPGRAEGETRLAGAERRVSPPHPDLRKPRRPAGMPLLPQGHPGLTRFSPSPRLRGEGRAEGQQRMRALKAADAMCSFKRHTPSSESPLPLTLTLSPFRCAACGEGNSAGCARAAFLLRSRKSRGSAIVRDLAALGLEHAGDVMPNFERQDPGLALRAIRGSTKGRVRVQLKGMLSAGARCRGRRGCAPV
jgi:hypothetical protein